MKENPSNCTAGGFFSCRHLSSICKQPIRIHTLLHSNAFFHTSLYTRRSPTNAQTLRNFLLQKWQQRKKESGSRAPSSLTGTALTCGTTTWTWLDCWRSCAPAVRGTMRTPCGQRETQQRTRGATFEPPGGRDARTPQRPAACRTPAPAGLPQASAASAGRTGRLQGCTSHTNWSQRTGKSSAPSCGGTPAQSVKPPGTTLTHAGTARRRSGGGRLRRSCQCPGSGRQADGGHWETDYTEKTVHNSQKMFWPCVHVYMCVLKLFVVDVWLCLLCVTVTLLQTVCGFITSLSSLKR